MICQEITLRFARDDDGDGIADVIRRVFSLYPGCPFDRSREFPELDAIASHMAKLGGQMWVAETKGSVVGCFGIIPTACPRVYELYKVYLLPEARGRGLAARMLAGALDFARAGGAHSVRLWTDTRFIEGHAFYRRNGFVRLPVTRYLADLASSWEFAFRRDLVSDASGRNAV